MVVRISTTTSSPRVEHSFLAGSFAHAFEVATFGHLLDRLRVEQEISPELSMKNALSGVWKKGKWEGLYRGFRWNIASSALKGGFGWSIFNLSNRGISICFPPKDPKRPSFLFSTLVGTSAAFIETSAILSPLERLKTVSMTDHVRLKVLERVQKEGLRFFYKGWTSVMVRQTGSWAAYLNVYQFLRQSLLTSNEDQPLSLQQKLILGGATGSLVATMTTPLDLLKTHAQKANTSSLESMTSIAHAVVHKHGWKGLYNGLNVKILRQGWSTMITLVILDYLKALPTSMKI
jgi:hypothetical protein